MNTEFIDIIKSLHFSSFIWLLALPSAMMGIDIITGLLNAWAKKNFQSAKMRSGLAKKAGELLIILIGLLFYAGMALPIQILNFIALYIIVMELMSIAENLDQLGAPLPKVIKDVINNVGNTVQNDEMKDLMAKLADAQKTIEAQKAALAALEVEEETRIREEEHHGSQGNF